MATNVQLHSPRSVFVSSLFNEIYIADYNNHRIRKILSDGNIVTIAGNGQKGFSGDNGLATSAQLYNPSSIFVSSNHEVYIADSGNNRIRTILRNGNIITIAGNGQGIYNGDNILAINANISSPSSVFVSSNHEVYIADSGNNRIRKILRNGNIKTIAGNRYQGFSGDNGLATKAQLYNPSSVFVSSFNEIYIADTGNHRIRKILRNGNIITIAGNGEKGYSGDNNIATNASLDFPSSVFVSSNNEIYIADCFNHSIRKILKNGNITTILGNGKYSDDILTTETQLYYPQSVFVSCNDEVYIADYQNHLIRKILRNGKIVTLVGNGQPGYGGDSVFDFSKNPHIGGSFDTIYGISNHFKKKFETISLFDCNFKFY